jgi:hypothetical protein
MARASRFRFLFAAAALCFAGGAGADIYRWVDQDGLTHYSNEKPRDAAVRALAVVEDRLSVYTPDPNLTRAIEAFREERREAAELAARARAYEDERGLLTRAAVEDRDPVLGETGGVWVAARQGRRLRPFTQPEFVPGRTAGMLVEQHGLVPGTTGYAPSRDAGARPQRSATAGFTVRGHRGGAPAARASGGGFTARQAAR